MPNITDPVLIDGFSQPGAVSGANRVLQIEVSAPSIFVVFEITGASSSGSAIRGLAINGFQAFGIQIFESSNNTITSNYIELNPAGTATAGAPAPGGVGIIVGGNNAPTNGNVIGGNAAGLGNVIAANAPGFAGIEVGANAPGTADNTVIRGNFVGTDKTGTIALGNSSAQGITIIDVTHTTIGGANGSPGGACSGDCNLISGVGAGIIISGSVTDTTTISGNYLGTDVSGTLALPNPGSDILIYDAVGSITGAIAIGGATPAARNVISSSPIGVEIEKNPAALITIQGNYIGTDRSGGQALGNGFGIFLRGTGGVKIGGVNAGEGNLISGNTTAGLELIGASGTVIEDNTVGPSAAGTAAPAGASGGNGVAITDGSGPQPSLKNQIGATGPGGAGGNVIAFNKIGVVIDGTSAKNSIFSNSIFSNSGGAVLLPGGAVNDHCDADSGPNQLQNFPVLNPVLANGGTMTVAGTLDSTGGQMFRIEFFSNPPAGSPQATTPIGSTTVTTDPTSCSASFSVTLPAIALNSTITAIATDATGNSSQLSAPVFVLLPPIQVAKLFAPSTINAGSPSTLTITLTNSSAIAMTGVSFTDTYPSGVQNAAAGSTTCAGATIGALTGTNFVSMSGGTVAPNNSCTVTVSVTGTPGTHTNTIGAGAVTSTNAAPNASPASASFTVNLLTAPTVSKSFTPSSIKYLGGSLLTITLTNPNAFAITGTTFNDIYPSGLANQAVPQASSGCGGGVTATPSGTSLALTGGSIPANGTCTLTVLVTARSGPTLVNTIGPLGVTSANAAPSAAPATAVLTVDISAIPTLSLAALAALGGVLAMIALLLLRKGA